MYLKPEVKGEGFEWRKATAIDMASWGERKEWRRDIGETQDIFSKSIGWNVRTYKKIEHRQIYTKVSPFLTDWLSEVRGYG